MKNCKYKDDKELLDDVRFDEENLKTELWKDDRSKKQDLVNRYNIFVDEMKKGIKAINEHKKKIQGSMIEDRNKYENIQKYQPELTDMM